MLSLKNCTIFRTKSLFWKILNKMQKKQAMKNRKESMIRLVNFKPKWRMSLLKKNKRIKSLKITLTNMKDFWARFKKKTFTIAMKSPEYATTRKSKKSSWMTDLKRSKMSKPKLYDFNLFRENFELKCRAIVSSKGPKKISS